MLLLEGRPLAAQTLRLVKSRDTHVHYLRCRGTWHEAVLKGDTFKPPLVPQSVAVPLASWEGKSRPRHL